MGDAEFWASLDGQLAELNSRATVALVELEPEPEGLPPRGSWIRAYVFDDDAQVSPATPWHHLAGWNGRTGYVALRCRRYRPGDAITAAMRQYLGTPDPWYRAGRRSERYRLDVALERPSEGVCRQCAVGLERDELAVVAAEQERTTAALLELLPAVQAIATDPGLDDAECGRRLRSLWRPIVEASS